MRRFATLTSLILGLTFAVRAEVPAGWSTDVASALANQTNSAKPLLLYFGATWCGPCKLMSRTTLTNDSVREVLGTVDHVAVDIDDQREVAAAHGVQAVPTFVMLSGSGDEIQRTTGFQPADVFLLWLTNAIGDVHQASARAAFAAKLLADVDRLLASTNAETPHLAAVQLFDLCADRDATTLHMATERLKRVASRDPVALLEGLNDSRLITRIHVANALRERLGERFDVDPWSGPGERVKAVEDWRSRLALHAEGAAQ